MHEPQPVLKERPRRPTIVAMSIRIARRKSAGNGGPHGIMNEQAVTTRLDEWQHGEPFDRVTWRHVRQERVEERLSHATDNGTGFECAPRDGIGNGLDIRAGQRLDDLVQAGLFDRPTGVRQDDRRGHVERQRMPASDQIDRRATSARRPTSSSTRALRSPTTARAADSGRVPANRGRPPRWRRRVAACDGHARIHGKGRDEDVPNPRVHQTKGFERVQRDRDLLVERRQALDKLLDGGAAARRAHLTTRSGTRAPSARPSGSRSSRRGRPSHGHASQTRRGGWTSRCLPRRGRRARVGRPARTVGGGLPTPRRVRQRRPRAFRHDVAQLLHHEPPAASVASRPRGFNRAD